MSDPEVISTDIGYCEECGARLGQIFVWTDGEFICDECAEEQFNDH